MKNSTKAKSVRLNSIRKFGRFGYYGYTFDIPDGQQLLYIHVHSKKFFLIQTDSETLEYRACFPCKRLLLVDQFYKHNSCCKSCHKVKVKRLAISHPELAKQYAQKYGKKYRYRKILAAAGLE